MEHIGTKIAPSYQKIEPPVAASMMMMMMVKCNSAVTPASYWAPHSWPSDPLHPDHQ